MVRSTGERKSASERRIEILEAALTEFAEHGFDGASTDVIARAAGISQPYLFRLFGTKKHLFIAAVDSCMAETLERFRDASDGLQGMEAIDAMGRAYIEWIQTDPRRLHAQMQAYAACADDEICAATRAGYAALVAHVEGLGVDERSVSTFFAHGMLINVMSMLGLPDAELPWGARLLGFGNAPPA